MDQKEKDTLVIAAALKRLTEFRLPRILGLKKRIDGGEVLDNIDLQFLQRVLDDTGDLHPIIERNPKYLELWEKAVGLCEEIMEKSEENESSK